MQVTTIGLDLAKRVFQLHWLDMETGEICRRQLKRAQVVEFFANREPAVVAMEACGSAHYWGPKLAAMGHQVRLIAAQFVRPFVKANKTDAADAQAIGEAAQRPGMRFVALKSEGQQSVLMMHRMREQLVKMRTMQINQLRGLLYEFGADLPQGRQQGIERIPAELERLEPVLPAMVIATLRSQVQRIEALDKDIVQIEKQLAAWKKEDASCKKLLDIPGGVAHGHSGGGEHWGCQGVQEWAAVRGLCGAGATTKRHRRTGEVAWHQQARGCVSAHLADSRSAIGH